MAQINTVDALRTTALQNAGVFAALFARAPKTVTFKGKTYLRASMQTVEQRLWYLSAAAQTQPSALSSIASAGYSLDEVYGLDPDRSGVVEAETALRAATAAVSSATSKVNAMKRRITDAEGQLREALAAQKEAQKVQVGDIFTAGISAAGRNLYADGQVQIWKDRINSLKTGSLVGMAGQEGWAVPLNAGLTQLQSQLTEAKAAQRDATAALTAAKASYDAEARSMRAEEERQRQAQAADAQAAAQAAADAAARDAQAAAQLAASQAASQSTADYTTGGAGGGSDPTTWEGYSDDGYTDASGDAVEPDYGDDAFGGEEDFDSDGDDLDDARDLFPDDEDAARAYAEDTLGVDDADAVAMAQLSYTSPYSFDAYYGADCDGSCGNEDCDTCDEVSNLRGEMLDAGWGFDGHAYFADKLGDDDEQGGSRNSPPPMPMGSPQGAGFVPSTPYASGPGTSAAPFDFAAIIPLILGAVMMLAPLIMKAFGAPVALEDGSGNLSAQAQADVHAAQPIAQPAKPDTSLRDTGIAAAIGLGLLKVLG